MCVCVCCVMGWGEGGGSAYRKLFVARFVFFAFGRCSFLALGKFPCLPFPLTFYAHSRAESARYTLQHLQRKARVQ